MTTDLIGSDVDFNIDITKIQFKANTFDIILCIHVLEHVENDNEALMELYRILKPDGWAIIQVPIDKSLKKTYEDPLIKTPEERKKHFGQCNHVRKYGLDYLERLQKAGFKVQTYRCRKEFSLSTIKINGLDQNEDIYYCIK